MNTLGFRNEVQLTSSIKDSLEVLNVYTPPLDINIVSTSEDLAILSKEDSINVYDDNSEILVI